ncbi:unnamed protein product [Leuciscus chuanchicus]
MFLSDITTNLTDDDAEVQQTPPPPLGPALSIASINIEGFSRRKADIATVVRRFDIVCMQETHIGPAQHRPAITGMKLVAQIRHRQYGQTGCRSNKYNMFIDLLKRSARRHIPRGCQTEYISWLSETSSDLLKAYHGAYHEDPLSPTTIELGEILLNKVGEDPRQAWKEQLKKHQYDQQHQNWRRPTGEYRRTAVPDHLQPARALTKPFHSQELEAAMSTLKPGKAAGIDDVLAEMIQHLGPKAKTWLLEMLNSCMAEKIIPPVWRKAKTVAIFKPGKDP